MERQETSRLLGNLPWRRPAGPSWPLKADRKVTPHGQVLLWRNYGYGLAAKTSLRPESVHHCMCPIFHAAAGRRGQKWRTQSALTQCASLHVSRFPDGSDAVRKDTRAVTVCLPRRFAGNCFFDNIKNATFLRDFLIFRSWQHQKRSISARLPHCSKLTTSKTKHFCETLHFLNWTTSIMKQFCETASVFQFYNIKNKMNSARLPSRMESWVQSWQPRTNAFYDFSWFFHSTCRKYCACHEKVMPGHTKCCTCHAKSSEQTYRSDAPKCSLSQEISALTS